MAGPLDAAGAARLIDATTRIDPRAGDRVVVHLDAASSLDAAGIGALCYAEAFVRARGGGRFAISTPSRGVHATLELAGLGRCCTAVDDTGLRPEADRRNQTHRAPQPAVPR
jgi:anti-anti-sigma factor